MTDSFSSSQSRSLEIVILAAGRGTRMRSTLPKVLHPLAGRPLLAHVLDTARALRPAKIHVVIGHGAQAVRDAVDAQDIVWVEQVEQLGTGHAVLQALPGIATDAHVLVLYGDVPLLRPATLHELISRSPALLTACLGNPGGYGRVVRDGVGGVREVVEHKDADAEQLAIREINTGVMAFPGELLAEYLPRVGNDNAQGEFYLPDVLSMAVRDGHEVAGIIAQDVEEVGGINDRVQLAAAETVHRRREADRLMLDGATLVDPARIDVRGHLSVGEDVLIDVNCVFEGEVSLGSGVRIGPNCVLRDTQVAAGAQIHAMSHLDGAQVGASCSVGPFARLRPGTRLARGARVGNFVETKKAQVGEGSKINHLSYVGDAVLGAGVNIGAGTITCNYDGQNKHPTQLGDGVFIGSNSTLVAPVEVADGGFVAAGSTLTRDVPAQALGVARARQRNIDSWQTPRQRAQQSESDGSQEH